MRKLTSAIDRFCSKHPRFGIPNLMRFIIFGNVAVFLIIQMDTTGYFTSFIAFNPALVFGRGYVWQLISFIFIPQTTDLIFIIFSLYLYYMIGNALEYQWGTAKFTLFYLSGMFFTMLYGSLVYLLTGISFAVTATYINLSMFFAYATFYPEQQLLLFFIIPVKIKWLAIIDAAIFLWGIVSGYGFARFLPLVAVLSYIIFCGEDLLSYIRPNRHRRSPTTINFKKAAKKVQKDMKNKPYSRKCSVCGITDADDPGMEFRYCSRCQGYHCFCKNHIDNHVHFEE